jgi:hypothetical protein
VNLPGGPVAAVEAVQPPPPPLVSARQLVGASFDLVLGSGEPLRRASFYIGAMALALIGPFALAVWGIVLVELGTVVDMETAFAIEGWLNALALLALVGLVAAVVESQGVAIALLGSHLVGRPLTVRQAVQRARMTFWPLVLALLAVSLPALLVQTIIGDSSEEQVVAGLFAGIAIQFPFVYAPAGIVLGGVRPVTALLRSIRIVGARRTAALIVAVLPAAFSLLIGLGVGAGIDVVVRVADALGLSPESGPLAQAILTVVVVAIVFAVGTLVLTASAIIHAPQVVMFVGLTRATMGLDAVRPGGSHAVDAPDRRRFRWLPLPMLLAIAFGALGLSIVLATIAA